MNKLEDIATRVWQNWIERDPTVALEPARDIDRVSTGSLAEAQEKSSAATSFLRELSGVDRTSLSSSDCLTLDYLQWLMGVWEKAEEQFWFQIPVAPYTSRDRLNGNIGALQDFQFVSNADSDRYVDLLFRYVDSIDEIAKILVLQRSKGVVISALALPGAEAHVQGYRSAATKTLVPARDRLRELGETTARALQSRVREVVDVMVLPAFDRVLAYMSTTYADSATGEVGFGRYPGGEAYYREALRIWTTSNLPAEDLHEVGLQEVAQLSSRMADLRSQIGLPDDEAECKKWLASNPAMFAKAPHEVEARYHSHLDRIGPNLPKVFSSLQQAPYRFLQLEASLETTTTYGFYSFPTTSQPTGAYNFNGSELASRSLLSAATLALHEIIPGHHLQVSKQIENASLPDVRRQPVIAVNAFIEGWAEYAAGLGWELGAYEDPYDAYGRMVFERFFAQRMVIDTGMNVLGWTLEEARDYMRANTMESEVQVRSETLRYSTDFAGQAVAYRFGHMEFEALRRESASALGPQFDVRDFHDRILDAGALPMPLVRKNVEQWIAESASAANSAND